MKVLITALALVTLIASPTFAQRQYPGEFYPTSHRSPASAQSAPAARKAAREDKLLFTLHVSGNFEDPGFT